MSFKAKKHDLVEALQEVSSSIGMGEGRYGAWENEIEEALQYAVDNYDKQDKDPYIATLEAKVYAYEMIIAKSNFRSMLDSFQDSRNKHNNKQGNKQNNSQKLYNNPQNNGHSSFGRRSQNRTQNRSQNGTYRPINNQHNREGE